MLPLVYRHKNMIIRARFHPCTRRNGHGLLQKAKALNYQRIYNMQKHDN